MSMYTHISYVYIAGVFRDSVCHVISSMLSMLSRLSTHL